jgi:hypothetical protein
MRAIDWHGFIVLRCPCAGLPEPSSSAFRDTITEILPSASVIADVSSRACRMEVALARARDRENIFSNFTEAVHPWSKEQTPSADFCCAIHTFTYAFKHDTDGAMHNAAS